MNSKTLDLTDANAFGLVRDTTMEWVVSTTWMHMVVVNVAAPAAWLECNVLLIGCHCGYVRGGDPGG